MSHGFIIIVFKAFSLTSMSNQINGMTYAPLWLYYSPAKTTAADPNKFAEVEGFTDSRILTSFDN
jgi:hypothetical protein